ncbi:MAG: ATP-binding protein [Phycisphaerales bacterium]|nr:ATP-binding protein [Phycisphaerales bacterium]
MNDLDKFFFRRLCEGLGFVCVAIDCDMRIIFWNDQACRQFNRSSEEMVGNSFLDILNEQNRDEARQLIERTIATKSPGEMEVKYPDGEGAYATWVLILSPILDDQGLIAGASVSMRDISKRKRLSQELARSRRMTALGRMAGGVAHHFNNILGGMLTSIDYVLTSDSPRELRKTLRLLAQAIGRATRITNQLAAFAESENEPAESMELNPLIDTYLERIRAQARREKIHLETEIAEVRSEPFEAQRLIPALESLTQNAFDAMSEGGTLTVTMVEEDETAVIRIKDTGCGIPDDMKDRLFEPFFTTKGELGGGGGSNIGLGLAAVHGLVSEMEGTIHLTSKIGEGTQVEVRLPLFRSQLAHHQ